MLNSKFKQNPQLRSCLLVAAMFFALYSPVHAVSGTEFEQFISQGEKALSAGELDSALSSFENAASINTDNEVVHQNLANVYLLKGNYANSIKYFHSTLGFNSKSSKAFIGLGLAYLHTGQYTLAKAALEEARPYSENKQDIDKLIDWIKSRQQNHQP